MSHFAQHPQSVPVLRVLGPIVRQSKAKSRLDYARRSNKPVRLHLRVHLEHPNSKVETRVETFTVDAGNFDSLMYVLAEHRQLAKRLHQAAFGELALTAPKLPR